MAREDLTIVRGDIGGSALSMVTPDAGDSYHIADDGKTALLLVKSTDGAVDVEIDTPQYQGLDLENPSTEVTTDRYVIFSEFQSHHRQDDGTVKFDFSGAGISDCKIGVISLF